ncbi:MAG: carotenoid biosynthesis protein [Anaerolineae bacterium]|nr:carotenoid biosynthesis protein [Anaerolineae bacterium]
MMNMVKVLDRGASLGLLRTNRQISALIAVWVLSMVSLPIQRWLFGDSILVFAVSVSVVCQLVAVLVVVRSVWRLRRTLVMASGVAVLGWLVEFVGSSTGFPFGSYHYTELLQPQIAKVPVLIPLAWLMMLPCAWAVTTVLIGKQRSPVLFAFVTALVFTAWDLFLDPQMVVWGFWVWENPVGYFGIPWVNFLGWILSSFVITLLIRPGHLTARPLLLIYGITWALESIGLAVFWGLPGPAGVGFVVMGSIVALTVYKLRVA